MIELMLAAAAQVQTMRLPPIAPPQPTAPVIEALPPSGEVTGFPDLAMGGIRVHGPSLVEFEVRNHGPADAIGPIGVKACAALSEELAEMMGTSSIIYCSSLRSVATIRKGESRWVRIDCFRTGGAPELSSGGGLRGLGGSIVVPNASSSPTRCAELKDVAVASYSAGVDRGVDLGFEASAAPAELQRECDLYNGCIRETNENNNSASFKPPFGD